MGFDMCDMFSSRVDFVCPKAGFKPGGLREGNLEHICTVLQHFKWVYSWNQEICGRATSEAIGKPPGWYFWRS
jgi:hypothetical protein